MQRLIIYILLSLAFTIESAMAEAPVVWNGQFAKSLATSGFMQASGRQLRDCGATDPSAGAGIVAPKGSICQYDSGVAGSLFVKTGAANNAWTNVLAASSGWLLTGNAGTAGTGVLGTTDAFPWSTIVNGSTIDTYGIDFGVSSILNITPVNVTAFNQKKNQVNLTPTSSTAGASFSNQSNSVTYDGGNTGDDYSGSIYSVSNGFSHPGSGVIDSVSLSSNSASFSNAGTTTVFNGVESTASVTGPYSIPSFLGVSSTLIADQLSGDVKMFTAGPSFNDSVLQGVSLLNGSMQVQGTTTAAQGINGLNLSANVQDTAAINQLNGGNIVLTTQGNSTLTGSSGLQLSNQLQGASVNSGNMYGISNASSASGTSSVNGITGDNVSVTASNTANVGNLSGLNSNVSMIDNSVATSVTGISTNPLIQNSSNGGNVVSAAVSGQVQDTATAASFTGISVTPQVSGNSVVTSFSPFSLNASVQNTATVTNGVTAADIQLSSTPLIASAKGLSVNITGTNVADPLTRTGVQIQGGLNQFSYNFTVPAGAPFLSTNQFTNTLTVANGAPVNPIMFATYVSPSFVLHDNWPVSAFGIGPVNVSAVNDIAIDPTFTMDEHNGFMAGVTNPSGTGTLGASYGYRAAGVINQGGAITVNNVYGFSTFAPTFCGVGTNCWAFYDDTAAQNYLNRLAIGTASKKVTAGYVLDMVGQGLQTYAATDAVATGIQLNDSTHTTVNGSNNTTAFQANASGTVDVGALNDKPVAGTINTATRGNGTDDGTLEELNGATALLFVNSGAAGVTNKAIGFDVTTILQQGTVVDLYDFRSVTVPAGGTATNQYGIYVGPGAGGVKQSWLADRTVLGSTSFSAPNTSLDVNGDLAFRMTADASVGVVTALSTTSTSAIRLTGAGAVTLQGISGGVDGKILTLSNQTGAVLTVANQNGGAGATDRIITGTGASMSISNDAALVLQYDATQQKWLVIAAPSSGGGGGGTASVKFTLSGAVVPYEAIDGVHNQTTIQSLTNIYVSALNSGTSGTTVVRVNQYRAGALIDSQTASLASNAGLPDGSFAALSGTLSLQVGDIISVDVDSAAAGASELSVEY
jgi:hypothetical protein